MAADRDANLKLAAEFSPATQEAWLALVDKVLAGAPFDKTLVSRTYDGIAIQPLFTRTDWNAGDDPSGFPGGAPFVRGSSALANSRAGWDIRQSHGHPDPAIANRHILEDLERGATSIVLRVDAEARAGTCIRSAADLDLALRGMMLDLAPVVLEPSSLPTAALLMRLLDERGDNEAFAGNFGADPLGHLAVTGRMAGGKTELPRAFADMAAHVARNYPNARTFVLSTLPYHSAGCAEAQELGIAMANAAEVLRLLTKAGLDIDAACGQLAFTVAADADMFLTIAKIRALRRLWARVAEACGASVERRTAPLTACTAPRMMSRRDPWVNILRTTVACFAAGIAGADAITVLPFDHALGPAQTSARRIARNTHVVLQEEASLARVIDPAGGAWLFEHLTDALAEKAWAFFQKIERAGGMLAALTSELIAEEITAVRSARLKNIARRKDPLTGLSEFPDLRETPVPVETVDATAIINARGAMPAQKMAPLPAPSGGVFTAALVKAAKSGIGIIAMEQALPQGDGATCAPLPQIRLGQEFERLRDAGDAFKAKCGDYPKVFLAAIGTLADFTPRASFAKNFFEAGGFATELGATDANAVATDFKRSKAAFAVICGPDRLYEAQAVPFARALKEAGAALVYLAGRGGAKEADLRAAGVDGFIFIGCDVPEVLDHFHRHLDAA